MATVRGVPTFASCRLAIVCFSALVVGLVFGTSYVSRSVPPLSLRSPAGSTVEGEVPRPPTSFPNGITVGPTSMLNRLPQVGCGPALRLTSSRAKQSGAAWYNRKMQVREGFDTSFTFRLSDPSTHCKFLDDAYTHCRCVAPSSRLGRVVGVSARHTLNLLSLRFPTPHRSRGGDGFAFVVQNQAPTALGEQGMQLGYGGIQNSLAIEFDTWYVATV